jgi:hypothetical protein
MSWLTDVAADVALAALGASQLNTSRHADSSLLAHAVRGGTHPENGHGMPAAAAGQTYSEAPGVRDHGRHVDVDRCKRSVRRR